METESRMAKFKIREQLRKVREAKFHKQQEIEKARNFIEFALFTELIDQEEASQYYRGLTGEVAKGRVPIAE